MAQAKRRRVKEAWNQKSVGLKVLTELWRMQFSNSKNGLWVSLSLLRSRWKALKSKKAHHCITLLKGKLLGFELRSGEATSSEPARVRLTLDCNEQGHSRTIRNYSDATKIKNCTHDLSHLPFEMHCVFKPRFSDKIIWKPLGPLFHSKKNLATRIYIIKSLSWNPMRYCTWIFPDVAMFTRFKKQSDSIQYDFSSRGLHSSFAVGWSGHPQPTQSLPQIPAWLLGLWVWRAWLWMSAENHRKLIATLLARLTKESEQKTKVQRRQCRARSRTQIPSLIPTKPSLGTSPKIQIAVPTPVAHQKSGGTRVRDRRKRCGLYQQTPQRWWNCKLRLTNVRPHVWSSHPARGVFCVHLAYTASRSSSSGRWKLQEIQDNLKGLTICGLWLDNSR